MRAAVVHLVHSPCYDVEDDRLEPPLGLLYLGTVLARAGHDVRISDLSSREAHELAECVPDGGDVYGFSSYSVTYGVTLALARAIRERNPRALLVVGGPHASALPAEVARDGFDVVVTQEAEAVLPDIVRAFAEGRAPPGVAVAGTSCRLVAGRPPDVNDLPHPDYELVDIQSYRRRVSGERCLSILTSRGCPYRCTFCNSNIMGAGRPMRYRRAADVVAEIRDLKARYGIGHFRFQDDIFTLNRNRVAELTPLLAAEGIEYRCFGRIDSCSPEMAGMLRRGGCVHVSFGVESGSRRILSSKAMNKRQTPAQIAWALTNAHAAGLRIRIFLIVGFPGESDETVAETVGLMKRLPWDEFSVYPLIAYPGTPLHDEPEKFGITHVDRNYSGYVQVGRNLQAGFTLRTPEFDEHRVREWRDQVRRELLADGRVWAGQSEKFR